MSAGAGGARRGAFTIYLTVWALLAAAALAYLAMLAIRPELLARSMARGGDGEAVRALAKVAGEMQALRQIASETKVDVAEIKARVATQEERTITVVDRVNAIEQRIATSAPAPLPGPAAKQGAAPIVTGSVAQVAAPAGAAAAQFGQIEVTRAAPVAIQLATGASVEALRLTWTLLSERHKAQLKALEPRYVGNAEGTVFALVAGPVATREEAQRMCVAFKQRRVSCTIADYAGEPL